MAKKKSVKSAAPEQVEDPWTVINATTGRRCYLPGARGLTKEEAQFQSNTLAIETKAVPVSYLEQDHSSQEPTSSIS